VPNYPGATVPTAIVGKPYAVPAVITKPYVQRVLNALEAVEAQATTSIASHHAFTATAATLIQSVTTPNEFNIERKIWLANLKDKVKIPTHPGPAVDAVQEVFPSTGTCLFASLIRRQGGAIIGPPLPQLTYIVLRVSTTQEPNPTPWLIDQLGYNAKGLVPRDVCDS
jgi:hypothetical protein